MQILGSSEVRRDKLELYGDRLVEFAEVALVSQQNRAANPEW